MKIFHYTYAFSYWFQVYYYGNCTEGDGNYTIIVIANGNEGDEILILLRQLRLQQLKF